MCPHSCIARWILNQWATFLFKILSLGARAASSKDMSNELEEEAHHLADGWDTGWPMSCWRIHSVTGRLLKQDLGLPLTRVNDIYLKMFIQDPPTCKKRKYSQSSWVSCRHFDSSPLPISFLLTTEISVQVWKCLSGAIKSKHFEVTSESAEFLPPVIFLSEHRSRQGSCLHWALKDFDFQKEDKKMALKESSVESQGFVLVWLQGTMWSPRVA